MRLTLVQAPRAAAIVTVCDDAGTVGNIIRDSFGLEQLFAAGREFSLAVEPQSVSRTRVHRADSAGKAYRDLGTRRIGFARRSALRLRGTARTRGG